MRRNGLWRIVYEKTEIKGKNEKIYMCVCIYVYLVQGISGGERKIILGGRKTCVSWT